MDIASQLVGRKVCDPPQSPLERGKNQEKSLLPPFLRRGWGEQAAGIVFQMLLSKTHVNQIN